MVTAGNWRRSAPGLAIVACGLLVLFAIPPWLVLSDTIPWGPDISAHAYPIWSATQRVLDGAGFIGWDTGWFDGWVAFRYYPPLPAMLTALLSSLLPFAVAYKVVIGLSVWLIPVTAAFLGWRVQRGWVSAAWAVVAATAFVLTPTCYLCGGGALSTLTGEYANVLGIAAALWALGELVGVLRGERPRVLLGIAFAATALMHPLPFLWLIGTGFIAFFVITSTDRLRSARGILALRVLPAVAVGLLIASWWWLPFVFTREWMTRPDFPQLDVIGILQAVPGWPLLLLLAIAGSVWAVVRRDQLGLILLVSGLPTLLLAMALSAGYLPDQDQLPNWRFMPYVLLSTYWLAALAVRAGGEHLRVRGARTLALAAATAVVVVYTAWSWGGVVPGVSTIATSQVVERDGVVRVSTTYQSQLGPWRWDNLGIAYSAHQRLEGQQRDPLWPTMQSLISTLERIGAENGCARVVVDQQDTVRVDGEVRTWNFPYTGSLLPYWTRGCITSLTGLQYDGTFLAPAIIGADTMVSAVPEPFGIWNIQAPDLVRGAIAMADLNVDYFVTREEWAAQQAAAAGYLEVTRQDGWVVFALPQLPVVEALNNQPYVLAGQNGADVTDGHLWQQFAAQYLATEFSTTDRFTLGGPPGWPRSQAGNVPDPAPLPAIDLTDVVVDGPDVRFRVSEVGVPVLIRRAPNADWTVQGASGPWPINPGFIAVLPEQNEVTVTLSAPPSATAGKVLGIVGLLGVIALALFDARRPRRTTPAEVKPTRLGDARP